MDVADLWLFWFRPKKALKLYEVKGKWKYENGFIALGTHWGTGFVLLHNITQNNKRPLFVFSSQKVPFSDRGYVEWFYRICRRKFINILSGSSAIATGNAYNSIINNVNSSHVPVLLFDAPKDHQKAKYFLTVLDHKYAIASGFVDLICNKNTPYQVYKVDLDFVTGKRKLIIDEKIDSTNKHELIKLLSQEFNQMLRKSPEKWFLWRQANQTLLASKKPMEIPVLLYHSANITGDTYKTNDCLAFEKDLKTIKENGIVIISADTLVNYINGDVQLDEEKKYVVITFDDGVDLDFVDKKFLEFGEQKSFYTSMKESNQIVHATSFVIASAQARKAMENDQLKGQNLISESWWKTAHQSKEFSIGNHSWDHLHSAVDNVKQKDNLKSDFRNITSKNDADSQIQNSGQYIAEIIGETPSLFAYPYGHFNCFLADDYFPNQQNEIKAAFTCEPKYANGDTNIWKIPRFICGNHWDSTKQFKQIINGKYIMEKQSEFFLVGSVLSGTTLLRNILREHPNLIAPEETHVFRWGYPFGSEEYSELYKNADTFKLHRKIDGMSEEVFADILNNSIDKLDFFQNYLKEFAKIKQQSSARCFDKSPQNVYGMVLIKAYFPKAKFIHIIRNPFHVIASIKRGHPNLSKTITASINYWKEAILITRTLKKAWNNDIYELKYEDLCSNPKSYISEILDFIHEEQVDMSQAIKQIRIVESDFKQVLTPKEIEKIKKELDPFIKEYSYHEK